MTPSQTWSERLRGVVVVTGDKILAFSSPARDKPFSVRELDAIVQRSCRLHRAPAAEGP